MLEDSRHSPASPPARLALTAVLLAGGKSSRMGRDKAGVTVDGQPLWERQLAILRQLEPWELFVSGKQDGPYAASGVEVVTDLTPGCGPLSGLEAALHRASCPFVVVLAIDLPAMTADFLAVLIGAAATGGQGVVPRLDGWFEPLAAVYPVECLPLVRERLSSHDFSMQAFVTKALEQGLVVSWEVAAADARLFRNVNTPEDLRNSSDSPAHG